MTRSSFAAAVLRWYATHARDLPWRTRPDPYRVWISEIMLQQTRVDTVIPYFERWMTRFPNVSALAAASEREVLSAWEGLGYYARARNLRKAAAMMVELYSASIPSDLTSLRSLPGIGRYTAGAIASIAFGADAAALDGNIRRVLARVFNLGVRADSAAGQKQLWRLAESNLPSGRAAEYNQALMDLGATICLPEKPRCDGCPLRRMCTALRLGNVAHRPVLRGKKPVPEYAVGAAVIARRGRVLLAQRAAAGLLGGLWEFPNVRLGKARNGQGYSLRRFSSGLDRAYGLRVSPNGAVAAVRHAYSHFRVRVQAHSCQLLAPPSARFRWIKIADLSDYPMGKVDREIARQVASRREGA